MFEFIMSIRTKTIQDFEKFFLNILRGRIEADDAEEALVEYNGSRKEVKRPEIQEKGKPKGLMKFGSCPRSCNFGMCHALLDRFET